MQVILIYRTHVFPGNDEGGCVNRPGTLVGLWGFDTPSLSKKDILLKLKSVYQCLDSETVEGRIERRALLACRHVLNSLHKASLPEQGLLQVTELVADGNLTLVHSLEIKK